MSKFWILPIGAAVTYGGFLLHKWRAVTTPSIPEPIAVQSIIQPVEPALPEPERDPELDEISRLQNELTSLASNIAERERIQKARRAQKPSQPNDRTLKTGLTPDEWKFAARATPEHAIESLLWAGACGDTQAMIDSIEFDEQSLTAANDLFQSLPADLQSTYGSAASILASMIVDDMPLAEAKLLDTKRIDETTTSVSLVFTSNIDPAKHVRLRFKKQSNNEWKLSVPPYAIAKYASELGVAK